MMEFKERLPEWNARGVEPPKSMRDNGWKVGDKPPADWFNWLQTRTYKSLEEIRDAIKYVEENAGEVSSKDLEDLKNELVGMIEDIPATDLGGIEKDIENLKKKKADKEDLSRSATIIIASSDSYEESKKGADKIIQASDDASVEINKAIQSLAKSGGIVQLTEGTFNYKSPIRVSGNNVQLKGYDSATKLICGWEGKTPNFSIYVSGSASIKSLSVVFEDGNALSGVEAQDNAIIDGVSVLGKCFISAMVKGNSVVKNSFFDLGNRHSLVMYDSSSAVNNICTDTNILGNVELSDSFSGYCGFNVFPKGLSVGSISSEALVGYNLTHED